MCRHLNGATNARTEIGAGGWELVVNLPARAIADGVDLRLPETTVRLLQRAAHDANAKYAPY